MERYILVRDDRPSPVVQVHIAIAIAVTCIALRYAVPEIIECIRAQTDTEPTNWALGEVVGTQVVGVIFTRIFQDRMSWAWALLTMLMFAGFGLLTISANWW